MHRRAFLQIAAAWGATSAISGSLLAQEKEQSIDEIMEAFPKAKSIPEIARIDRLRTDGAKRLLVVLRQMHLPAMPKNAPANFQHNEEDIIGVEQSQLELFRALNYLVDQKAPGLNHVMFEDHFGYPGFVENKRKEYEELLKKAAQQLPHNPADFFPSPPSLEQKLNYRVDKKMAPLGWIGAGPVVGFTRRLEVLPGGDAEFEKKVDEELEKTQDEKVRNLWIHEKREMKVYALCADSRRRVSYIIYGCDHSWKESQEKWNKEHPHETFSTLMLTSKKILWRENLLSNVKK